MLRAILVSMLLATTTAAQAQTAPSTSEIAAYTGLHRAAQNGDVDEIRRLAAAGMDVNARDGRGRTPAHVAAFASNFAAASDWIEVGSSGTHFDCERSPASHFWRAAASSGVSVWSRWFNSAICSSTRRTCSCCQAVGAGITGCSSGRSASAVWLKMANAW